MKAMNAKSDPTEEERKGGSGHIGKMIFSAGAEQLAICAYVPEAKQEELSCEEWLKSTLALFSGEVVSTSASVCMGRVKTDADKNIFPLKIREAMIIEANNFLRKRGLFPEDDSDDEDEMVFGDDDFPSADAEEAAEEAAEEPKEEAKEEAKEEKVEEKEAEKPAMTEEELKAHKDKMKKVVKEGGKRGVEIEGAADMGGLQFFCCSVDMPEGDLEFLAESMKAMNAKSDPTEEERKGGSGHIGKMIFSAGSDRLAVVAYVPEAKQGELSCEEWLKTVVANFGGEVLTSGKELCTGKVATNSDKGVFPLKIREPLILEANNFLRKKGLFPEDDDDDDECVFGDDDFPSM